MTTQKTKKASSNTARRVTRRVVNSKRHTVGYFVDGEYMTVSRVRQLASRGDVSGVRVVGRHVQAIPGRRLLSSLPQVMENSLS